MTTKKFVKHALMEGVTAFENNVSDLNRKRGMAYQPNAYFGVLCAAMPLSKRNNVKAIELSY